MAVGKNPGLMKGKKGGKKKIIDPFTRKEWYEIKAPNVFKERQVGKTLVTRTTGRSMLLQPSFPSRSPLSRLAHSTLFLLSCMLC